MAQRCVLAASLAVAPCSKMFHCPSRQVKVKIGETWVSGTVRNSWEDRAAAFERARQVSGTIRTGQLYVTYQRQITEVEALAGGPDVQVTTLFVMECVAIDGRTLGKYRLV